MPVDPLFLIATLALNVTPGPDMLYVTARTLGEGRRAGIVSAFGIAGGTLVHTAVVTLGLAAIVRQAPLLYDVIRYAGAAYLVFLGLSNLLSRAHGLDLPETDASSPGRVFIQGVITNVLNPKVALFFVAFLPQFVRPGQGAIAWQLLTLAIVFNVSGTTVNCLVALGVNRVRGWLTRSTRAQILLRRVPAVVFIGLGARLALDRGR